MKAVQGLMGSGLAAVLALGAGIAEAKDVAMRPYLVGGFLYDFADSERETDNGIGGFLGGGLPLSQHFNFEIDGSYANFKRDKNKGKEIGDGSFREYAEQIAVQYFFSRNHNFAPYFEFGLGHGREALYNRVGGAINRFADGGYALGGVGAIHYFKLGKLDLGVRAAADFRRYFTNDAKPRALGGVVDGLNEPVLTIGLVVPIGSDDVVKPEETVPVAKPILAPPEAKKDLPGAARRFDDIHFAFDKSDLSPYSRSSLDADVLVISKLAESYPTLVVDLAGHTDWIGTDAYNQSLSERRANAVETYLTGKGVKPSSIKIHAYGESKPVAPNTTAAGRALNRRVEIKTLAPQ